MTSSSAVRLSALLHDRAATSGLPLKEFTALLADTAHVPFGRAAAVLAGDGELEGFRLRSVIAQFALDREQVTAALDPTVLLSALWCPAVGEALVQIRDQVGASRDDVALAAGVSTATLRRWEQAQVTPRVAPLGRLLTALGVTAKQLLVHGDWPPSDLVGGDLPAFALWLRSARAARGVSQTRMAYDLLVSQGTYNAWELGRTFPTGSTHERLAGRLTRIGSPVTAQQVAMMQPAQPATDPSTTTHLGALISARRYAERMSYTAAAHFTGLGESTLRSWEWGKATPAPAALRRVVEVYGLDVDEVTAAIMADQFPSRDDRGAWIASRIHTLGWNDRQGASRIGVHRNVLSFWATGKTAVPDDILVRVARALRTTKKALAGMPAQPCTEHSQRAAVLKAVRERSGLTQRQLGALIGVEQSTWSAYENGRMRPSLKVMTDVMALALNPVASAA